MPIMRLVVGWLLLGAAVGWGWRRRVGGRALALALAAGPLWLIGVESTGWGVAFEWQLPLASLVLSLLLAAEHTPERWLRRPTRLVTCGVVAWAAWVTAAPVLLARGAWTLDRERAGDIYQSQWWSCGPAALTTLAHGFRATPCEADAAEICDSWPTFGTFPAGLAAGLRRCGLRPRVHWLAGRSALTPGRCGLAYVLLLGRVVHIVALEQITPTSVQVFDPAHGRSTVSLAQFERTWLRVLVDCPAPRPKTPAPSPNRPRGR